MVSDDRGSPVVASSSALEQLPQHNSRCSFSLHDTICTAYALSHCMVKSRADDIGEEAEVI